MPVNNAELPTYCGSSRWRLFHRRRWAGRYHIWAEKEAIIENVVAKMYYAGRHYGHAYADVLSQQTGDFLINEGASFTNLANVTSI